VKVCCGSATIGSRTVRAAVFAASVSIFTSDTVKNPRCEVDARVEYRRQLLCHPQQQGATWRESAGGCIFVCSKLRRSTSAPVLAANPRLRERAENYARGSCIQVRPAPDVLPGRRARRNRRHIPADRKLSISCLVNEALFVSNQRLEHLLGFAVFPEHRRHVRLPANQISEGIGSAGYRILHIFLSWSRQRI
jgi:hypothetical protein